MRYRQLRVTNAEPSSELPIVAFDLNGVLADANAQLLRDVKSYYGLTLTVPELTGYGTLRSALADHTKDPSTVRWLKQRVNDPAFIMGLAPMPGARELWNKVGQLPVERRIVTGHDPKTQTVLATERWLQAHGFHARADFVKEKDGWCRQTRCRWLVEDSPLQIEACAEAGTKVFVAPQPYNRGLSGPNIVVIGAFLDVVPVLCDDLLREGR